MIVHASAFPVGAKGTFQHAVGIKLSNGLVRNGHFVLNFSDRELARALSFLGHRKFGRRKANEVFRAFCQQHQPDVLLLGHADSLSAETIAAVRADLPRLRVLQWNVDPVFEPDNMRRIASKLGVVDATLVSTAGEALSPLRRPGRALGFLPNPVDLSIERGTNHLKRALEYDLFYVCGHPSRPLRNVCGQDWDMERLVQRLLNEVPGLRPRLGGLLGHGRLSGAAFQQALESSAIGLNISRRGDYFLYSSDRLAQTAGNGQAVVIERATGYDKLFTPDQMGFFSSIEELTQNSPAVGGRAGAPAGHRRRRSGAVRRPVQRAPGRPLCPGGCPGVPRSEAIRMAYADRLRSIDWDRVSDFCILGVVGGGFVIFSAPLWALFFYLTVIPLAVRQLWLGWRPDWRDPAVTLPLALIAWSVLTLLWSDPPPPHAISRGLWVWNGLCTAIFFLTTLSLAERSSAQRERMISVLLLCGLANVLATLGVFFAGGDLHMRLAGWANTRNSSLGATIVALCAILAFSRSLQPERRWLPWAAMLLPFSAFMLLSESRGALLFLGFAALPLLLLREAGVVRRRRRVISSLVVVLVATAAAVAYWQPSWVFALISQTIHRPPLRFAIWRDSIPQVLSGFWFGHGPTAQLHNLSNLNVTFGRHPHDLYLATVLYSGIVGLLLLLACFGWLLYRLVQLPPRPERALSLTLLLYPMLCGVTDLSQVIKGPSELWYIIWLPLLLSASVVRQQSAQPERGAVLNAATAKPDRQRVHAQALHRGVPPPT